MAERVLWIGGAQWTGKSTVAELLGRRFGVEVYHYDFHDSRGHAERVLANPGAFGIYGEFMSMTDDERWVNHSPETMAGWAQAIFDYRFEFVLEDLAAMDAPVVVAEGWGIRPRHVARVSADPRASVFLLPSREWQEHQLRTFPKANSFIFSVSDPQRAQENRIARNELIAADCEQEAGELGLRIITVDGLRDAEAVADDVADHFGLADSA